MKKTSFLLASLTAIVLLSCSNDNSNSFTEDVNYPQTQALQKVIPDDEAQQTCYVDTYTASQTIGVTITTSGATVRSPEYAFTPTGVPTNATITGIDLNTGTMTYTGAVLTNYWKVRKGSKYADLPGGAGSNVSLSTTGLNGELAKDTYYVSVDVTCVGFGTAKYCSKLYSRVNFSLHYCVQ